MILESLELSRFRNYRKLSWHPGRRVNLLIGQNAQGKTNVLEAIALLMRGRTRRVRTRMDIVAHGERDCRLSGQFQDSNHLLHAVTLTLVRTGERLVQLDGQKLERTSLLFEILPCVFQESTDLEMLSGPPAGRRSFVDMLCLELDSHYVRTYAKHEKLLKSRNALLARGRKGTELDIVTSQFAEASSAVVMARVDAVSSLSHAVAALPAQAGEELSLGYVLHGAEGHPGPESAQALSSWYREKLPGKVQEELRLRASCLGPQRDDLKLVLGGRPVKGIASRGQLKDILLRLKLAEVQAIRSRREEVPVVLLDDAFSETDAQRRRQMMEWIPKDTQVFLTGTDPSIVTDLAETEHRTFHVRRGSIEGEAR